MRLPFALDHLRAASFVATLAVVGAGAAPCFAASWQQAQGLLQQGRYEQALHVADPLARGKGGTTASGRASVLIAARAEIAMGLLSQARKRLEEATAHAPSNLPLRAELSRVAMAMGDRATVHLILQSATRLWQQPSTDRRNPANLVAMASIAQQGENWKWGNELFREAVQRAPNSPEPNVGWAYLFLEKHAAKEAAACFADALKVAPRHPDALVGLARTQLEKGYDRIAAQASLQAALKENPRHLGALALQAEIALDGEDFQQTETLINSLRNVNPRDPDAAWLAAAVAKIRNQAQRYEDEREARLDVRPGDGDFFANVAEALVRQRRYHDARAVTEECLLQAPREARCHNTLGTTLLRLGEEANGLRELRTAFEADPYNVRTYNQLQLFEKTIKTKYRFYETEHLRFRVQAADQLALERIVAPHLEEVFRGYVKRYGYTPAGKVTLELYADPADFAVRTVGLPVLDVTAVCFGPVITTLTPTAGAMNWGIVLSHELAHVFSIGLSQERVPRWLTEGLAEWETGQLQAQWRRRDGLAVWTALRRKSLPPLGGLSKAFFEAQSNEEAVVAYLYSAHAVEFLIQRFGFEAIRDMLLAFAQGKEEGATLQRATSMSLNDLNSAFAQHLEARYSAFAAQFLPTSTDAVALTPANAESPHVTADELVRATLFALQAANMGAATSHWARAQKLVATSKRETGKERSAALYAFVSARMAEQQGADVAGVVKDLQSVIGRGFDGYEVRLRLGMAALQTGDWDLARKSFEKAVALAPDEVEGWMFLSEARTRLADPHGALKARLQGFLLDPQNGKMGAELVRQSLALQAVDLVLELAPWVVFVDPDDAEVHAAHGRALQVTGRHREAAKAYGHALAFGYEDAAALKSALAKLHEVLGDNPKADKTRAATQPPPLRGPAPPLPQ